MKAPVHNLPRLQFSREPTRTTTAPEENGCRIFAEAIAPLVYAGWCAKSVFALIEPTPPIGTVDIVMPTLICCLSESKQRRRPEDTFGAAVMLRILHTKEGVQTRSGGLSVSCTTVHYQAVRSTRMY